MSLGAIVSKGDLIRKVFFPRIILVVSGSMTALMTFSLNLIAVLVLIFFTGVFFGVNSLFFPLLILELFVLTLGIALVLSSLFVRFRDLGHIWEVTLQILFYATPILYPLSFVPQKIGKVLLLSPIAQIIQDSRYVLITTQTETAWKMLSFPYFLIPYTLPLIVFIMGYWLFQKSAAKFAEEI
jgi:ABC-2 type transport system permease protein